MSIDLFFVITAEPMQNEIPENSFLSLGKQIGLKQLDRNEKNELFLSKKRIIHFGDTTVDCCFMYTLQLEQQTIPIPKISKSMFPNVNVLRKKNRHFFAQCVCIQHSDQVFYQFGLTL